ncbi:MAG: ferrous iron transport protein A [Deltaproteobacteria bacterium]|nr:ferrous iron transport protein A [Deltaproteobacteria bacterium]
MNFKKNIIKLAQIPAGRKVQVKTITGGANRIGRLASMGLTTGADVVIVQNYPKTPLIIKVRETLIALGRSEASGIKAATLEFHKKK